MHPTTQLFKDNIYAPARRTVGKVTFDISDVTAAGDVTSIVTSAQAAISDKQQLINKVRNASFNLATWETDRFRLDGSFSFPDDTIANNGEVGFVSAGLCDSTGVFSPFSTITFTFGNTHSSAGLTVTFDMFTGEYAVDYNVSVYNAADALITSVDITGNTDVIDTPLGQLTGYKKVVITIKKWSVGDRRARVLEVDFGIVKVYTDDNLINMSLIEELDLTSGKIPSTEFKFSVDNSDRMFNILNPTGFYAALQQRQQVIGELGLDVGGGAIEWVPLFEGLLTEWQSEEGSIVASFTARTKLDVLAADDYENLVAGSTTLYALAQLMFTLSGITNYWIDPALSSITTNGLVKKTSRRDVLQMVAIAGCANIFVTRDNVITLKVLPALGAADDVIDLDNAYTEPQIELDKIVKQVAVTYWTDLSTSAVYTATNSGVTDGDTLKLENNTLINDVTRATGVANWILAQKADRAIYKNNWRGNPAQELGDVIEIENTYGANKKARITKTEIEYAGYLSARTEARGAVG